MTKIPGSLSVSASVRWSPETQVLKSRFRDLDRHDLFFFFRPKLPSSTNMVFFSFFFSFRPKLPSSTDKVFFLPLYPSEIVCHYMLHITSDVGFFIFSALNCRCWWTWFFFFFLSALNCRRRRIGFFFSLSIRPRLSGTTCSTLHPSDVDFFTSFNG